MLHMVPVLAPLARRNANPILYVSNKAEEEACRSLLTRLGAPNVEIIVLRLPAWLDAIGKIRPKWARLKVPRLLWYRELFSGLTCLVAAEYTSTLLKRLPGRTPFMIHFPHGAGDRARTFDSRMKFYDHIIVPGAKSKRRMVETGASIAEKISISGYVKAAALAALHPQRPRLFDNDRPTVLYNPHFAPALSSWQRHGLELIRAFSAQKDFNLIVAPHTRLFQAADQAERQQIMSLAIPGKILIDLGSEKSNDMTYTRGADIYLGDVSSQVYEFLLKPKPCVFLGPKRIDWQNDPNYRHWTYGDVCFSAESAMEAVRQARANHANYVALQKEGIDETFHDVSPEALDRAAALVLQLVATGKTSA